MAGSHQKTLDPSDQLYLPAASGKRDMPLWIVAAVGLALAVVGSALEGSGGMRRAQLAYLVAFAFVLSLSLGGLFFTFVTHLFRAGWSVVLRRPAELLAANLGVVALMFLPILFWVASGDGKLYPWAVPDSQFELHAVAEPASVQVVPVADAHAADEHAGPAVAGPGEVPHGDAHGDAHGDTHGVAAGHGAHAGLTGPGGYIHQNPDAFTYKKRGWLNRGAFAARWVGYFALWGFLAWWYFRGSVRQDVSGDHQITYRFETRGGIVALLFGLSFTFASWDLLMSLNPHWYSTIFGVYYFAGTALATFSLLSLIWIGLQSAGYVRNGVTAEHYHDLGKAMFTFVVFWTYIAFSQYLLLWYASLPETTVWLANRGMSTAAPNGWSVVILALLFGHFVVPFIGLMSRRIKRRRPLLAFWAIWLLGMHWLDLCWLVMPEYGPDVAIGLPEVGFTVALLAIFAATWLARARKVALVPIKDPKLGESLSLVNF